MRKTAIILSFALVPLSVQALAQDEAEGAVREAEAAVSTSVEVVSPEPDGKTDWVSYQARQVTPLDGSALYPTPADYPIAAWQADEAGTANFELAVNAEGVPTSCTITESSGSTALDEKTCEIAMKRGRFDPARDEAGNPIDGSYSDSMRWRKREPEFPGTLRVTVEFMVDAQGKTSECKVIETSGAISESMRKTFEREPCPGANGSARAVYRDENGMPVAKRVRLDINVVVEDAEE